MVDRKSEYTNLLVHMNFVICMKMALGEARSILISDLIKEI